MAANIGNPDEADVPQLFEKATNYVRTIAGKLEADKLLYLYARFKQAKEGPCNVPRPGFFDFQGKQKWDAWNSLGSKSREEAMLEYISLLDDLDSDWQEKAGLAKSKAGLGVAVSTLCCDDEELADEDKTLFDFCKEGDVARVNLLLKKEDVDQKDEEDMALLHWACDRGLDEMIEVLIRNNANINIQDADGQTPLHYAASCGHLNVVQRLLTCGANSSLRDTDQMTPLDVAECEDIKRLLSAS